MNKSLERSGLITQRMKQCLDNGEIMLHHELELTEHSLQRLNLVTISEYARRESISPNGAKHRVKTGKVMSIDVSGLTFISIG